MSDTNMILRPYQEQAVNILRTALRDNRSVLYVLPTGGGKTVIFTTIGKLAAEKDKHITIVVHRQELTLQASCQLAALQLPHKLVTSQAVTRQALIVQTESMGKKWIQKDSNITIASVQTLVKHPETLHSTDLLILDEAHHAPSKTWEQCVFAAPKAKILGVTATALRLDGKGLSGLFERLICGPAIMDLILDGFLSIPVVYAPPTDLDVTDVHSRFGDYKKDELIKKVDRPKITGCAIEHYQKLCDGQPAIAFCASVKHADHVAHQFRTAGYNAQSVDGTMSPAERRMKVEQLGTGEIDILCSCDVISEGVDVPIVSVAILLRPTQSLTLYLQQVGRCLRPAPGKNCAYILDHAGNVHRHGHPAQTRDWSLDGGRQKHKADPLRTCPECYAVFPPKAICPRCGFRFAERVEVQPMRMPQQVAGQLEVYSPAWAKGLDIKTAKFSDIRRMANTRERLEEIARVRGYKPGWVKNVLKGKEEARQRFQRHVGQ